jgi:anthranilate synthase component II
MATQHRELPRFGVQFHPESILTPEGPKIVENFLALAKPAR